MIIKHIYDRPFSAILFCTEMKKFAHEALIEVISQALTGTSHRDLYKVIYRQRMAVKSVINIIKEEI